MNSKPAYTSTPHPPILEFLLPVHNKLLTLSCTKVYRLLLNSPCKSPLAYGETMTMMTPYGIIGWERVN